jgi:hypothetical protein
MSSHWFTLLLCWCGLLFVSYLGILSSAAPDHWSHILRLSLTRWAAEPHGLYIYNFRCLFADDHSLGWTSTPVGTMEKISEIVCRLLQISHAQIKTVSSLSSNLSFLGLNMPTKRPHSERWRYQCGVLVDPRHDHALWGYMSRVEVHYVLVEPKLFLSTGSKAPVCLLWNFCL